LVQPPTIYDFSWLLTPQDLVAKLLVVEAA